MTGAIETVAPTRERIKRAAGLIDAPQVTQQHQRRAWRLVPLVLALHREGKIGRECLTAHERFEEDWAIADRTPSGVGSYGERMGGDHVEGGELRKIAARRRMERALAAIGSPHGRRALVMSVSATATGMPYPLAQIGRACGSRNRPQAIAGGTATLRDALYQLHQHYDES